MTKKLNLLAALSLFVTSAIAQSLHPVPAPVAKALQQARIPVEATGVHVQEIGATPALLSWNATNSFNPASTMKLVTSNAGLEILGPTFTWKTEAYAVGPQTGDVLLGDLVIRGSGDPKLVLENLWLFLRRIRDKGIREISGDLILDRSAFEEVFHDAGLFDEAPLKPYNVGPDALLLNYKSVGIRFLPVPGQTAVRTIMDPPLAAYPVLPPSLGQGECGDWRSKVGLAIDTFGIRFDGVYPASCGEQVWHIHPYPLTHVEYFHLAFRRLWADLGGTIKGGVKNGVVPEGATLVAEWTSPPLAEIVRDINKHSNNVMARQLLLTLGRVNTQLPASGQNGGAVVRQWLADKGIDAPELQVDNGSGLSRSARLSPLTLARMLNAAFAAPTMPEFVSSLPLVGYDGTMRKRLVNHTVAGKAHIKTGMLDEVRNIGGYVLAASGKRYVVVFMINHPGSGRGREAQDRLLQWVYENG